MKSYTDLEQSKKLAEILPLDSADMGWDVFADDSVRCLPINDWDLNKDGSSGVKFIPAWSLAALLDQLEDVVVDKNGYEYKLQIIKEGVQYYLVYEGMLDAACYETSVFDNLIDACVEMIVKLKEKDLL